MCILELFLLFEIWFTLILLLLAIGYILELGFKFIWRPEFWLVSDSIKLFIFFGSCFYRGDFCGYWVGSGLKDGV